MRCFSFLVIIILFVSVTNSCISTADNNNNKQNDKKDPTKFDVSANTNHNDLTKMVKKLFEYIEERISKGDYEGWYKTISQKYKNFLNNPDNLKKISEKSDFLFNRNFTLKTPKDYFQFVVIQSRDGKTLEFVDVKFVNENHLKVICLFDKTDELVYDFVKEDGSWKVDR